MTNHDKLWNNENDLTDIENAPNYPAWIKTMSPYDMAAIEQGGCESGAYMPAVTYYDARKTMSEYGNDVLEYISDVTGELPQPPSDVSWDGMAVFYLSIAVELWVVCNIDEVIELLETDDD